MSRGPRTKGGLQLVWPGWCHWPLSLVGHLLSLDTCIPRQEGSGQLGQRPRSGLVAMSRLASP